MAFKSRGGRLTELRVSSVSLLMLQALVSIPWILGLAACAFDVPGEGDAEWAFHEAEQASRVLPKEIYYYDEMGEISSSLWVLEPDDDESALVLVDGDLAIGNVDEAIEMHHEIESGLESRIEASVDQLMLDTRDKRKWPGKIRYTFDNDYYQLLEEEKDIINESINRWNRLSDETGIKWHYDPSLGKSQSGVRFDITGSGGCNVSSSRKNGRAIGEFKRRKDINLNRFGCMTVEIVMHEMAHIMGARHEQKREDRDKYIKYYSHNAEDIELNSTKKRTFRDDISLSAHMIRIR